MDGGSLILCTGCPRAYHYRCLDHEFKIKASGRAYFFCPQHQCTDCEQKTTDVGGMLYRCRWCARAYCEDCIEFDNTELIGENLKEYEMLGYPEVTQAFYIKCQDCKLHHAEHSQDLELCERIARTYDVDHGAMSAKAETRAASLTDGATRDSSGITTPHFLTDGFEEITGPVGKVNLSEGSRVYS